MSGDAARSRIVVVDGRSPDDPALQGILERARLEHEVDLIAASGQVLQLVVSVRPAAVLIHAGLERRPGAPTAGPLIAALCRRHVPDLPILLYTGAVSGGHEGALAQLGVLAPVVFDQRLASDFERIIASLVEHVAAIGVLCRRRPLVDPAIDRLPPDFRVERFLDEAELAITRAAIHEHANRTQAAAAVGMALESFDRYLLQRSLSIPRGRRPESLREHRVLWCSERPARQWVADLCEALVLDVYEVPAGCVRPQSVFSQRTTAAIVEPANADAAADVWTLARSVRPFLVVSPPPPQVRLLLEELHVPVSVVPLDEASLSTLVHAGRTAADLYRDEQPALRLALRPDGRPSWPIDRAELRRRLDARILLFASQTEGSSAAAAEAVALEERTFRRRLSAARALLTGVRVTGHG